MINTECRLSGDAFKPDLLAEKLKGIQLRNPISPGQLGKFGRYKGKPVPYGLCSIATPEEVEVGKRIEWMADFINENMQHFRECGATEIEFQIDWYGIQGNMELSVIELEKLASLKIPVNMNYFQL